jgi:beta-lactamase regulating signal transducer with metallopeptidase domain
MPSLASLRSSLLGTLLIILSLAALANTARANQTVATATTLGGQSPVQASTASCESLAVYVQMLEFLLVLVLIVAAVALFLLIRLYRKTRF